jgi:hypothetical protein
MKLLALVLTLFSTAAFATNWQLDSTASSLHFVTVKNEVVAETHHFSALSGQWDGAKVSINIAVNSMQTNIPIRNERIWQYVLRAEQFANINVEASLGEDAITALTVGDYMVLQLPITLTIAGESATLEAKLRISKLTADTLQASNETPLMLNTNSFKLTAGVAKLQELAGLNSIESMVPVSFHVQFTRQ